MKNSHEQGLRLLRTLIEEKNWDTLDNNQITDDDFYADSRQALSQLRKYVREYNEFPPIDVFESSVKANCLGLHQFKLPEKIPAKAAVDLFFEDKIERDLSDLLTTAKQIKIKEGAKAAVEYVQNASKSIQRVEKESHTISFKETAQDRLESYNKLKWQNPTTIPTPWPSFNTWSSGGWDRSGSPHNIVGLSSCGKSWSGVVSALNSAFNDDMRVLFVSRENGLDSIENRMDAYYSKIPYSKRRQGNLEFRSYDQYFKTITSLKDKKGDVFIDMKSDTVPDILKMSEKHGVDLVIVDGAYLVKPQIKSSNKTESLTNLAYEYQDTCLSQQNTAWVLTLQLDPNSATMESGKEMSMNIRYCKEFFVIGSTTLTLTADKTDRLAQRLKISFGKDREHGGDNFGKDYFYINDDKINMSFEERPELQDDPDFAELI